MPNQSVLGLALVLLGQHQPPCPFRDQRVTAGNSYCCCPGGDNKPEITDNLLKKKLITHQLYKAESPSKFVLCVTKFDASSVL